MSSLDRLLKLRFVAGADPGCVFRLTLNARYLDLSREVAQQSPWNSSSCQSQDKRIELSIAMEPVVFLFW